MRPIEYRPKHRADRRRRSRLSAAVGPVCPVPGPYHSADSPPLTCPRAAPAPPSRSGAGLARCPHSHKCRRARSAGDRSHRDRIAPRSPTSSTSLAAAGEIFARLDRVSTEIEPATSRLFGRADAAGAGTLRGGDARLLAGSGRRTLAEVHAEQVLAALWLGHAVQRADNLFHVKQCVLGSSSSEREPGSVNRDAPGLGARRPGGNGLRLKDDRVRPETPSSSPLSAPNPRPTASPTRLPSPARALLRHHHLVAGRGRVDAETFGEVRPHRER